MPKPRTPLTVIPSKVEGSRGISPCASLSRDAILESIDLIQEWSKDKTSVNDYLSSPFGVMAFNARRLTLEETKEKIASLEYIKKELAGQANFVQ